MLVSSCWSKDPGEVLIILRDNERPDTSKSSSKHLLSHMKSQLTSDKSDNETYHVKSPELSFDTLQAHALEMMR